MITRILDQLSDLFSRNAYSYCQLLTKSEFCPYTLVCNNGDCLTFFEVDGSYRYLTPETEEMYIDDMHNITESMFEGAGFEIEFYFVRDNERTEDYLNQVFAGTINTIDYLKLRSGEVIKKQRDDLKNISVFERSLIIVKTSADRHISSSTTKPPLLAMPAAEYVPIGIQSPYSEKKDLVETHQSFVQTFEQAIKGFLSLRILTSDIALSTLLEEVTHDLHSNVEFLSNYNGVDVEYLESELEHFSAPPLSYQIMSEHINPTTDKTIVERCGRYYAPLSRDHFPTKRRTFTDFISKINKEVNFRFSYTLILGSEDLKSKLATRKSILSFFYLSPKIRTNADSIEKLINMATNHDVVLAAGALSVTTWSNSLEQTKKFRKKITTLMTDWGNTQVSTGVDINRNYLSAIPAFSNKKSGRFSIQPLLKHLSLLPFNRTCTPMRTGGVCFSSLDGKLFPIENFPSSQNYTLNTVIGNMGGGKTVLLALIQDSFLWTAGNETLPLCGYMDWGSGISNYIKAVKNWLPEHLHYQAVCINIKNQAGYGINYLEPPFGLNTIVNSQEDYRFATRFTCRIINGNEKSVHSQLLTFVEQLIKEVFSYYNKRHITYSETIAHYVNDERELHNEINQLIANKTICFDIGDQPSWWVLRDKLFALDAERYLDHARFCHRQGSPTLHHLNEILIRSTTLAEKMDGIALANGTPLYNVFRSTLSAVLERFGNIFGVASQIDISRARVVGVNLKEVVTSQTDLDSQTDNKLFGLLGKYLISRQFWRDEEDFLTAVPDLYREMYRQQIALDMSGIKSQIIDEMGKVSSDELCDILNGDADVARKYRLVTTVAGQTMNQFPEKIIDKASNLYLVDGSESDITALQKKYDLSDSFVNEIHKHVGKPVNGKGRALLFIGKYNQYRGMVTQLLNNYISPAYLWNFSSDQIDMDIKDLSAKRFGGEKNLRLLARAYPTGSIKAYVKERLAIAAKRHEVLTERDVMLEIMDQLVQYDNQA
ncbi:hypothetical protein [Photobacterium leiognathi]|uniref:hypothetical protein n=1 Tax=Photobacterium leiognathi TaxID=553611 RepID=UPI002982A08B|nr:hypothetical protein [Photobacterium leiognathi]